MRDFKSHLNISNIVFLKTKRISLVSAGAVVLLYCFLWLSWIAMVILSRENLSSGFPKW